MSSLARRTFRTAAAAAGIAALGVGISAPAWAVEVPGVVDADVVEGPGVPGHTIDQTFAVIPASAAEVAALPQLFTFEAPAFTTAAPSESASTEEADVEDRDATDDIDADETDEAGAEQTDATPSAETSTLPSLPALGQLPANLRIPLPKGNAVEIGTP